MSDRRLVIIVWAILVGSLMGCGAGRSGAILYQREAGNGYCNTKFRPVGPSDPGKPGSTGSGDVIDYYGPCDERPNSKDQIAAQRRFEQFRFGRDYSDD